MVFQLVHLVLNDETQPLFQLREDAMAWLSRDGADR
jgi:hypothetical protein